MRPRSQSQAWSNSFVRTSLRRSRKHALFPSIPGVGEETANLILSEVPNLDVFAGAKQLVAFAGLAPKEIDLARPFMDERHCRRPETPA